MAEACVCSHLDGSFMCTDCVPAGEDPSEICEVLASDELDEYPECINCGKTHTYMIVKNARERTERIPQAG